MNKIIIYKIYKINFQIFIIMLINVTMDRSQQTNEILNKFTLKFTNSGLEEEYNHSNCQKTKKLNIVISTFCLILTLTILVWSDQINKTVNSALATQKLKVEKLSTEQINILKKNKTDWSSLLIRDSFVLVNETNGNYLEINLNDKITTDTNENFVYLTASYFVVSDMWISAPVLGFLELLLLIITLSFQNLRVSVISFCLLLNLSSFNFQFICGMIKVFYTHTPDPVYFVSIIDLFCTTLFILKARVCWISLSVFTILGIVLEYSSSMTIFFNSATDHYITFNIIIKTIIRLLLIIISYHNIYYSKKEYQLNKSLHNEKNYLMNFVENMTQGFLSYNNKNRLFANKSMKRIIEDFNKPRLFGMKIENISENANEKKVNTTLADLISKRELQQKENLVSKLILTEPECAIDESKIILEKMFSYVSEINSELPEEIYKRIKTSITEGFDLDEFFSLIKGKKEEMNFNDFISLGILKIDNIDNYIVGKTYQVLFRIITHNYDDDYLEIMFSDVSKILLDEREKTLLNARSIYLSKIAHEFRNPLTSLIELSLNIKDEIQNLSSLEKYQSDETKTASCISKSSQKILNSIDYSEKLYKIMIHFLKDFSVFSNLKLPCDKAKNGCENLVTCYQCGLARMCRRCSVCKFCEEKKTSLFDYYLVIDDVVETFTSLCKHENKNMHIANLESKPKGGNESFININYIKTNKELFCSALFNMILHSYKSTKTKTDIKIKVSCKISDITNEVTHTHFEIVNEGFEEDPNFLKMLNHPEKLNYEDDIVNNHNNNFVNDEMHSNFFNKNFELYISFCILKKLNSPLKINSERNSCIYSFDIINPDEDSTYKINSPVHHPLPKISSLSLRKSNRKKFNSYNSPVKLASLKSMTHEEISNHTKEYNNPLVFQYDKIKGKVQKDEMVIFLNTFTEDRDMMNNENDDNIPKEFTIEIVEENSELSSGILKSFCTYENSKRTFKVIIIDDEILIRKTMIRNLKRIEKKNESVSFDISEAGNCFEALNIIYLNYLENKQFDFVIIDEFMPFMKGSTLVKLLKQLFNENNFYKLIFISHTAFDTDEKKKFISECGADYLLSKPVEFREVEDFIIKLTKNIK